MIETAFNGEMIERRKIRNGWLEKTILTGSIEKIVVDISCYRAGTFEPLTVKKRRGRLDEIDEIFLFTLREGIYNR